MHVPISQIKQEQMSRVTSQIEHNKRIKNNLLNLQKQQDEEVRQNSLRLKEKMEGYEQKRQKKVDQKIKTYKLNEEKWAKKIEDIQTKFKHQNRQAIEKAEKYRQQSQDYWKTKETQLATVRGTSYQKFDFNKSQKIIGNNIVDGLLKKSNHKESYSLTQRNKYILNKVDSLGQADSTSILNLDNSRGNLKHSRTIDIDGEISKHRQKSEMLQKQRQMFIFQNAMKRLTKIQLTRRKAQKLKESSKSPVQIRRPKKHAFDDEDDFYGGKNSSSRKNHSFHPSKSKQSLLNSSIQSHIKAKRLLQEQEFKQRDKILQNEMKKKRQDKILKVIKNKIRGLKSQTIKMQTLQ